MRKYIFTQDTSALDQTLQTVVGWGVIWRDGEHALVEATQPAVVTALQPHIVAAIPHLSGGADLFKARIPQVLANKLKPSQGNHVTNYDMLTDLVPDAYFGER